MVAPKTYFAILGEDANFEDVTLTGDLTGDVIGNVTGNLVGNVTGTHIGGQQDSVVTISGDGAITAAPSSIYLSKGSAAAITIVAPTSVTHDGYLIRIVCQTAQAHVVTCASVGFNAKGSSGTITFAAAIGNSVLLEAKGGNWYVVSNIGGTVA